MKINRRSFLALGAGAAAGSVLTPVHWKLTDDLSIWTQNWPWTPVPADGASYYQNSICPLCRGGCGIRARKIDQRVVKIEGNEAHPVNSGGVCASGLMAQHYLYGPSRIKSPMKRVGNRGANNWQKITWDEAEEEVAEKLKKSAGPAVFTAVKTGSTATLFNALLAAKGSTQFFKNPSMYDSYELMFQKMHGTPHSVAFDFENSDMILSFGCGIVDGWGSPLRMFQVANAKRIVQIEPKLSRSASLAEQWLAVKPGTETDLAYGLCNIILERSIYNRDFITDHVNDFEAFKTFITSNYPAEKVAKTTGIPLKKMVKIATDFVSPTLKTVAVSGRGKGETAGELAQFAAVHALNALAGNINQKGGVWAVKNHSDIAARIDFEKVLGSEKALKEIDLLLVSNANPAYTLGDPARTLKGLTKIPYIVSFSSFMDETTEMADIILPDHMYLEKQEDVVTDAGLPYKLTGLTSVASWPSLDTRQTGEALINIAGKAGIDIASSGYEDYLKERVSDQWDALYEAGFVQEPYTPEKWSAAFANTPSGKFEFILEQGFKNTPDKKWPLVAMPEESMRLLTGHIASAPPVTKVIEDTDLKGTQTVVEINPETAGKYGLTDGATAILETPTLKEKVRVALFEGVMPGVISVPTGLGHKRWNDFLENKGINYNVLSGYTEDPHTGANMAAYVPASLKRSV